jgi:hypothetical protein
MQYTDKRHCNMIIGFDLLVANGPRGGGTSIKTQFRALRPHCALFPLEACTNQAYLLFLLLRNDSDPIYPFTGIVPLCPYDIILLIFAMERQFVLCCDRNWIIRYNLYSCIFRGYKFDRESINNVSNLVYECLVSFRFVVLPSSTYLFTVGVEGFDFSLDHTQTQTTVGRTSLDEGSARRKRPLTTQTLYKRQTSMPLWDSNRRSQQALGRRPTP